MSKATKADDYVLLEHVEHVAVLTLNRTQVLNAWHKPMREQLMARLDECENNSDIAAIVIRGSGDRAFCAGQDLNDVADFDAVAARAWIEEWRSLYHLNPENRKVLASYF